MHSKRPRSILSSIFASKRIAVALCAAIAMVLGAMSVGASIGHPPENPDDPVAVSQSEATIISRNFVTNPAVPKTLSSASTSVPSQQAALVPILIAEPNKTAANKQPKDKTAGLRASLKVEAKTPLGPISVNAKPQGTSIQLATPVTDPLKIIVTTPDNQPEDSDSAAASNEQPATTTPENPQASDPSPEPQQQLLNIGINSDILSQN